MPGPDLPQPDELFSIDVYQYRWPTGAEKAELWDGVLVFYGDFDHRDVDIAQRAYPGRRVRLDPESHSIRVHPGGAEGDAERHG